MLLSNKSLKLIPCNEQDEFREYISSHVIFTMTSRSGDET